MTDRYDPNEDKPHTLIEATEELLGEVFKDHLLSTATNLISTVQHGLTDSSFDGVTNALDHANLITELYYEGDLTKFDAYLNNTRDNEFELSLPLLMGSNGESRLLTKLYRDHYND